MGERSQGGGSLTAAGGTRRKAGQTYVVVAEWQNGEPDTLAAFTGGTAKQRAERYAEEMRYEYASGIYIPGKRFAVWAHEGYDDAEWDVDIQVCNVLTNPRIPDVYRRLRQRRRTKEVRTNG